jgi:hypothetical protein
MAKEKVIDGVRFSVVPFQAVAALKLKAFLFKKLGPALGQALGTLKDGLPSSGKISEVKLDGQALSQAIEKLMMELGEVEFTDLIKRMLRNVTAFPERDGKVLTILFTDENFDAAMDIVFTGRLFSVYPVMLLVLEANFPDFFGKMALGIGQRIQKMTSSEPVEPGLRSGSEESAM